jgi:hypothetical protein
MKRFSEDKFFMPKQYDLGTPEKDVTDAIETPIPLSKGFDGLPKFNELQEAQKKNVPKAMRSQVAFQQKKLQYSNYQVVNFQIAPSSSGSSVSYFVSNYNQSVAVGTAMTDGVLFGSNTKNSDEAKYYNVVYANARWGADFSSTNEFLLNPCFVEFYLMQKVPGGVFGGKIPRQIEAVKDKTNLSSLTVTGVQYGVQSFGIDVYNENAYYTQSPDLKGMRACGIALKNIKLNFATAIVESTIRLDIEIGIDLKTEGNNY